MTQQDFDKIQDIANAHTTEPRPQAWARLSEGLGHRKTKLKLSYYQKLSIAAAFVAVLSVGALFSHYQSSHHNPDIFASNEDYKPLILEELAETETSAIYNIDDVNNLRKAFANATKTAVPHF